VPRTRVQCSCLRLEALDGRRGAPGQRTGRARKRGAPQRHDEGARSPSPSVRDSALCDEVRVRRGRRGRCSARIEIPASDCSIANAHGARVVEPGAFELLVGRISRDRISDARRLKSRNLTVRMSSAVQRGPGKRVRNNLSRPVPNCTSRERSAAAEIRASKAVHVGESPLHMSSNPTVTAINP